MPRRTPDTVAADRALVAGLIPDLRGARRDLRDAIKALPAPAARTAAQRRDALIMRTAALLIQSQLTQLGVASPADRDTTET